MVTLAGRAGRRAGTAELDSPSVAGRRRWAAEAGLLLGLGALALALRLPNYQTIPIFTDETQDVHYAFLITQGKLLPLADPESSYNGALWNYLLASALRVSDFSLYAPRTLMLGIGVLTVLAAYPLGRTWGGRAGGLLAAALLMTSSTHVVVNSHVAWGNCATPLFTTLALWMLYAAVSEAGFGRNLIVVSGLFWGLALQTHPSVLALLPGAATYFVWRGRSVLRPRWVCLAAALVLLVNLNLLLYNLTTGFDSLAQGTAKASSIYSRQSLTPVVYVDRLVHILLGLLRHLGGGVDRRDPGNSADILADPGLWPMALLAAAGVAWQWRRGNPLPALLLAGMVLVNPLFSGRSERVLDGRYLAPLLPVLYAGVGALFAAALRRLRAARREGPPWSGLGWDGLGLAAAYLLLHPLLYLQTYYQQEMKEGRTNIPFFRNVELIEARRAADEVVMVDRPVRTHEQHIGQEGGGWASRVYSLALALREVPYRLMDLDTDDPLDPATRCRDQLVALALRPPQAIQRIVARLELRDLDDTPASEVSRYPVYRLAGLTDSARDCRG